MPNTKSAIRRVRRVKNQTTINKIRKSKYKSAIKKMSTYIENSEISQYNALNEKQTFTPSSEFFEVVSRARFVDRIVGACFQLKGWCVNTASNIWRRIHRGDFETTIIWH